MSHLLSLSGPESPFTTRRKPVTGLERLVNKEVWRKYVFYQIYQIYLSLETGDFQTTRTECVVTLASLRGHNMLFVCCVKNTIIDGGSTALFIHCLKTLFTLFTLFISFKLYIKIFSQEDFALKSRL